METELNYLAVLVATVVAYAVGALWHSPVGFGPYWMKLMGLHDSDMKGMPLTPTQATILGFVVMLVTAFVLAHFMTLVQTTTIELAMTMAFWVWLGFLAPTLANSWLWEGKSLKLFAFNAAYAFVSIMVMAVVLALWP